jgi:hypothetical protein
MIRTVSYQSSRDKIMHNTHYVDIIEQAADTTPYCPCGQHTTPVWRNGTVWLECASLGEPRGGVVARLVGAVTSTTHIRVPIVEVPAAA